MINPWILFIGYSAIFKKLITFKTFNNSINKIYNKIYNKMEWLILNYGLKIENKCSHFLKEDQKKQDFPKVINL